MFFGVVFVCVCMQVKYSHAPTGYAGVVEAINLISCHGKIKGFVPKVN